MKKKRNKVYDIEVIQKWFNRIEGQVRGINRMIDENKNCEQILVQINSTKSSLNKAGQAILERHIRELAILGIRKRKADEAIRKMIPAIEQFAKIN